MSTAETTGRELARRAREIWTDVLGPAAGVPGPTFFELDGQSISAVRIAARVEDELGVDLDIGDMFEDPDVEGFVRMIVDRAAAADRRPA